jgi:hypothetical protein
MKLKNLLFAGLALLCLNIPCSVYAQGLIMSKNQRGQTADTISIELGSKSRLLIPVNNVRQINTLPSINAALQRLNKDIGPARDSLINPQLPTTIFYIESGDGGRTLKVNTKDIDRTEMYLVKESGLIKTKVNPDSVLIELADKQRFLFILGNVNELTQLEKQDLDALLPKLAVEVNDFMEVRKKKDLFPYKGAYAANYKLDPSGNRKLKMEMRSTHNDYLKVDIGIGAALVRDQLAPTLGIGWQIIMDNHFSFGVSYNNLFFFDRRENGSYKTSVSSFLSLDLGNAFGNRKTQIGERSVTWQTLSVGYLINKQGNYFGDNTWKASLSLTGRKLSGFHVIPEIYFTDNFKSVFPGLRIGVGF